MLLPDPSNPQTAVLLAPNETHEAAVGDIRVRRIIVQETDEPISRTISTRLPWLRSIGAISGRQVWPAQIPADGIFSYEFSTLLEREQ